MESFQIPLLSPLSGEKAKRITEHLTSHPKVKTIQVHSSPPSLKIVGDLSPSEVIPILEREEIPYESKISRWGVSGIHCAGCAQKIEKKVLELPGVIYSAVNLAENSLTVRHLPGMLEPELLKTSLRSLGYELLSEQETQKTFQEDEAKELKRRAFLALPIAGTYLFTMFLPHTFPFVSFLHNGIVQFLFATFVMFLGAPILKRGGLQLLRLSPEMDSLITLSTSTAYLFNCALLFIPSLMEKVGATEYSFDASMEIMAILLTGRFLEARAKQKTVENLTLLHQYNPPYARLLTNGKETVVPIETIQEGDEVVVPPGERVPVDGVVLSGVTTVNTKDITGEPFPRRVEKGDLVLSGSLNLEGRIVIKTFRKAEKSTIQQVIYQTRLALSTKTKIQKLADRISAIFVPAVMGISCITFFYWYFLGPPPAFLNGITRAITVLIIACPCALGLATPTALVVAVGLSARMGILFRNISTLEKLAQLKAIAIDKTGTLTEGEVVVKGVYLAEGKEEELLEAGGSIEQGNLHPLAVGIVSYVRERKIPLKEPDFTQIVPGEGVKGKIQGEKIAVGTLPFVLKEMKRDSLSFPMKEKEGGVWVGKNGRILGAFLFDDDLRKDSYEFLQKIREEQYHLILLSGDNPLRVEKVAKELSISEWYGGLLPEEKVKKIEELRKKYGGVVMVGDGVNDAPSLAKADVGIAMGTGSEIAKMSGEVILTQNDLKGVYYALRLSKVTYRTIRENLFFSFLYNLIAIPVAGGVLYPYLSFLLSPWMGALAMALSDIVVVGNSLRIPKRSFPHYK